jgi:hypothetical protein
MTANVEKTKPSFEKRLRRIAGIIVLSAVLLPVATFVVWRMSLSMRLKSKLAAVAKAGYPIELADLERVYYPEIKVEANGAVFFSNAFRHLDGDFSPRPVIDFWQNGRLSKRAALVSTKTNDLLRSTLTTNEELLVILRTSPEFEKSRYSINFNQGLQFESHHLYKIRACEEILLLDAVIEGNAGHTELAVGDLKAAILLSQSLAEEPFLFSQRIRWICHQQINAGLELVLGECKLTDAQLGMLAHAVHCDEYPKGLERALAGERCCGIYMHRHLVEQAMTGDAPEFQGLEIDTNKLNAVASGFVKGAGILDASLDYYLRMMSEEISLAKVPYPGRLEAGKLLDQQIAQRGSSSWYHFYATVLLSECDRLTDRYARDVARLELCRTALAVERYRLANQAHLPGKLIDLVPTFLPSVPQDPFDGQPLRFKPLEKGYVIYSVGPDLTDDGGREWQRRPKGSTNDLPYDITFIVER